MLAWQARVVSPCLAAIRWGKPSCRRPWPPSAAITPALGSVRALGPAAAHCREARPDSTGGGGRCAREGRSFRQPAAHGVAAAHGIATAHGMAAIYRVVAAHGRAAAEWMAAAHGAADGLAARMGRPPGAISLESASLSVSHRTSCGEQSIHHRHMFALRHRSDAACARLRQYPSGRLGSERWLADAASLGLRSGSEGHHCKLHMPWGCGPRVRADGQPPRLKWKAVCLSHDPAAQPLIDRSGREPSLAMCSRHSMGFRRGPDLGRRTRCNFGRNASAASPLGC